MIKIWPFIWHGGNYDNTFIHWHRGLGGLIPMQGPKIRHPLSGGGDCNMENNRQICIALVDPTPPDDHEHPPPRGGVRACPCIYVTIHWHRELQGVLKPLTP